MDDEHKITRTIGIPIAEVVEGGSKAEFYADLRRSLKRCMAAANACLTWCAAADSAAHAAVAQGEKIPPCPDLYAYPLISKSFPGNACVASSIARAASSGV